MDSNCYRLLGLEWLVDISFIRGKVVAFPNRDTIRYLDKEHETPNHLVVNKAVKGH